jgi:NADH-quinone oxidoreductase subunit L
MTEALTISIPALPLLAFAVIIFFGAYLRERAAYVAIAASSIAFGLCVYMLTHVLGGHDIVIQRFWFTLGGIDGHLGFRVDPLGAVMLIVVSTVSLLVQIYSVGYMHGDIRFSRYFAYMSLFAASMLSLVLSDNFLFIFIFWEMVGICSYLLIGFWYEKKEAADAGKKAFITTRIGDLGFLVGLFIVVTAAASFDFSGVREAIENGTLHGAWLTAAAILLFAGASGKSAQFPLHVWLPDAMEGPTPVSALIHAATMVAAGVYLVARLFTIYLVSATGATVVAWIGGITALFAATIAVTQFDIKRVLAYSTLSQLGYMMLALGVGALSHAGNAAGIFHLMTHAFFKALLFLGAGSVIHATHTQDIREMGGLGSKMKVTATTFILASLSLAGIAPLSGFWSKDEILHVVKHGHNPVLFVMAACAAFLTAFYMFRVCFRVFFGEYRSPHKAHESPAVMTVPLVVLGVLTVCAGWVGLPWLKHGFGYFLSGGHGHHAAPVDYSLMIVSTLIGVSGIVLAYGVYRKGWINPERAAAALRPLYALSYNKYYIDEFYHAVIIRPLLLLTRGLFAFDLAVIDGAVNGTASVTVLLSKVKGWVDLYIVDGAVNGVGYISTFAGSQFRKIQTGHIQQYAFIFVLGFVAVIVVKLFM